MINYPTGNLLHTHTDNQNLEKSFFTHSVLPDHGSMITNKSVLLTGKSGSPF